MTGSNVDDRASRPRGLPRCHRRHRRCRRLHVHSDAIQNHFGSILTSIIQYGMSAIYRKRTAQAPQALSFLPRRHCAWLGEGAAGTSNNTAQASHRRVGSGAGTVGTVVLSARAPQAHQKIWRRHRLVIAVIAVTGAVTPDHIFNGRRHRP